MPPAVQRLHTMQMHCWVDRWGGCGESGAQIYNPRQYIVSTGYLLKSIVVNGWFSMQSPFSNKSKNLWLIVILPPYIWVTSGSITLRCASSQENTPYSSRCNRLSIGWKHYASSVSQQQPTAGVKPGETIFSLTEFDRFRLLLYYWHVPQNPFPGLWVRLHVP